jgi:hypothetical protein
MVVSVLLESHRKEGVIMCPLRMVTAEVPDRGRLFYLVDANLDFIAEVKAFLDWKAATRRAPALSGIGFLVQSSSRPRSCSRATLLRAFAFPLMQGRGRWQLPGSCDDLRPRFG